MGDHNHQSTSRDAWVAKGPGGTGISPVTVNGWRATLGDSDADSYLDERDNCPLVANADQTDSDGNTIGDACGPTFVQGTVGGSVPATLTLTLGPPPMFGAFTPQRDAQLRGVHDRDRHLHRRRRSAHSADPGRLANALHAPPNRSRSPSANPPGPPRRPTTPVTIAFKQAIKATDALRTGAYSRTLTFTLSTTTP